MEFIDNTRKLNHTGTEGRRKQAYSHTQVRAKLSKKNPHILIQVALPPGGGEYPMNKK